MKLPFSLFTEKLEDQSVALTDQELEAVTGGCDYNRHEDCDDDCYDDCYDYEYHHRHYRRHHHHHHNCY